MARYINSPGVQIIERDLSLIAPTNVGTNIFITGYANQGPTDEVLKITSKDELDNIYGTPTTSAERYFYHGISEMLNSPANIYSYRLPYGDNTGAGFSDSYSILAYPVKTVYGDGLSTIGVDLKAPELSTTSSYVLGKPVQFRLTDDQYRQLMEGTLFTWSDNGCDRIALSSVNALANAGLIVVNKSKTSINSQFEGYYLGVSDNALINPGTAHAGITGIKTVSLSSDVSGTTTSPYTDIPTGTLQFNLSANAGGPQSISEIMENLTEYNIDGREDDDVLSIGVFKLRKSVYATEAFKLDFVLDDRVVGSVDKFRTQLNPTGGPSTSFFVENLDDSARNIDILVNPYISNAQVDGVPNLDVNGKPIRKVRVLTTALASVSDVNIRGIASSVLSTLETSIGYTDALFPLGLFDDQKISNKTLGDIPTKLDRALQSVINDEIYDIDVVVEAGLGTVYAHTEATSSKYYDEFKEFTNLTSLQDTGDLDGNGTNIRSDYMTIFNKFENFCNLPMNTGGRGDCIFIADILRHIVVTGKNTKVLSDKAKNFQQHVYWPIRHQFETANTSYAAVYANWAQTYDSYLGEKVWVPFSSVAGAIFASSDAAEFQWSAPAGYTRGLVGNRILDIAVLPNQKQRDELYKANINPVLFSSSQGMAIFGQKTLSKKPSAFDRINVRRAFLYLERPTKKASMFFVFEPNNEFTRTRFVGTLTPVFEYAKNNGGVYDYYIVIDERNNTPEVIDSNEMKVDIFIKPTRTAEFILVSFNASRTDAVFEELI